MVRAIISFEQGDKSSSLTFVQIALAHLRNVLQNLYERMNDPYVVRSVWVRHVSGIHSWGAALESDEKSIEYGGLSGSQILLFLTVDAFLGIGRYHSEDEMKMHISKNMRDLCTVIGKHSFRKQLSKQPEDLAISEVLDGMIKQLRVCMLLLKQDISILIFIQSFRAVHKIRAVRYLSAPAPERLPMTAALSVLKGPEENEGTSDPYESINTILTQRLNETI